MPRGLIRRLSGLLPTVAVCLFAVVFAASAAPRLTLSPHHIPSAVTNLHLQPIGRLPASQRLDLAIGLLFRNPQGLSNLLEELYDPSSTNYHQFLTPKQFAEQFGPTTNDYQSLIDFARTNGFTIKRTHTNRALLMVSGAVSDIERAFHVTMRVYQHPDERRNFYAPDVEPTLDTDVPVLTIGGFNDFIVPKPMSLKMQSAANPAGTGSGPGNGYIGNDFRAAYVPGVALKGAGQSVALVEFDSYYTNDITSYRSLAGLPNVPLTNVIVDAMGATGSNNMEVSLDIDMAMALAPGLSQIIVYEGTSPDNVLAQMANDGLANQMSASWTYTDDANTQQDFQQFGAQGESFFNASGDSGAYTSPGNPVAPPTDDPYLTSVGGTTLTTTGPGGAYVSETVWNWYTTGAGPYGSSGGVSSTFNLPSWQSGMNWKTNGGSRFARNLPDVAFTGDNVFIYYNNGSQGILGGTSCAAPLWAAFTALVNQQAAALGQTNAGFLNPALYSIGKGATYTNDFNDITTGNNTNSYSSTKFFAFPGFDLCTGWGTPNGAMMISALTHGSVILTGQPTNSVVTFGGNASFSVSAVGSPIAYQWRLNGANIPQATNATYTITNAQAVNQGTYAVLVFNSVNSVLSSNATLSVLNPPVITTQPQSLSLTVGQTATFFVAASGGTPMSFQWELNSTPLADNSRISGSQTSNLVISNLVAVDAGNYQVVVSNSYAVSNSAIATLTVAKATPVVTWTNPAGIVYGTPLSGTQLDATANVPGSFGYAPNAGKVLFVGTNTLSSLFTPTDTADYNSVSKSVSLVVSPAPMTATASNAMRLYGQTNPAFAAGIVGAVNGDTFTASTACSATTNSLPGNYPIIPSVNDPNHRLTNYSLTLVNGTLTITPGAPPIITSIVPNSGATNGSNIVTLNGSNFETGAIVYFGTSSALTVNVTNSTNIIVTTPPAPPGLVDVILTNADGQSTVFSNGYTYLPPNVPPQITAQPTNQSVSPGQSATFAVTASGTAPLNFQWLFNQSALAGASSSNLVFTNVQTSNAGYYQVLVTNAYGMATSSVVTLSVVGVPVYFGAPVLGTNGELFLQLTGLTGQGAIIIQSSTNLHDWISIFTNPPAFGQLQLIQTNNGGGSRVFYRALTPASQ